MRKWKKINGFLILFITFFSACAGFSSWNLNSSKIKDFNINIDISKDKVAYFKDGNTKREFTTVAGALKAAADRKQETLVVVNPDTTGNVSITDCTIADKVTLIINYKAVENYKSPSNKKFVNDYTGDKDGGSFGDTAGSKSKIKLSGARKIESGGSLIIGGETGQNSIPMQGGTRGSCAELNFVEGGSIDCSGKIISYGFIHDLEEGKRGPDEAAIEVEATGSVSRPLTRYSWFGGETVRNIKDNVFPCNVFDLPNIRVPMLFDYGSTLTGKVKVNAQNTYIPAEASIIARDNSEGFLQLKSGKDQDGSGIPGSALFNADDVDTDKTSTSYSSHKTSIKTKGDFEFSGVSVSVGETIDTKKNYLPISGIFDISVGKGVGKIKYKTKLLPGASLRILPEARLTMEQNFVAYQNSKAENGNTFFGGYQFPKPATIYNEGTIEVKSGFDGLILTDSRTGCCSFSPSYGGVNDCKEFDSTSKAEGLHGILTNKYNYSTFKFFNGANRNRVAQRHAIDGTTSYISKGNENAVANRTYTSSATSNGKYGWTYKNEYKSYPIVIDTNGNDSAVDSNGQKYIENYGSGTTLIGLSSNDSSKTFAGYFYDKQNTIPLDKDKDGNFLVDSNKFIAFLSSNVLTIYSKWISNSMLQIVKYDGNADSSILEKSISSNDEIDIKNYLNSSDGKDTRKSTVLTDQNNINQYKIEYNFIHWKLTDNNTGESKTLQGTTFIPESQHSYLVEPVYSEEEYVWVTIKNDSWDYGLYWIITKLEIADNQSQDSKTAFDSTSIHEQKDEKSGWIRLGSTLKFTIESRKRKTLFGNNGGPNKLSVSSGSKNKTFMGDEKNKLVISLETMGTSSDTNKHVFGVKDVFNQKLAVRIVASGSN